MIELIADNFSPGVYLNESLWLGRIGHFSILSSFVMAGLAFFSYTLSSYHANNNNHSQWKMLGRLAFSVHGLSIATIFLLLFIMILNHHFEYYYAWRHSSVDLPLKYIISSFWEGQEGSFLLWQFWHVILGIALIFTSKKYESPVMAVVMFVQMLLGTMVLGIHVFGWKVGVNPFVLLRHEMFDSPIFSQPDYLNLITDGNGLNPLLQNYWMVIHPPVLFLGFASTVVPFAFAFASMVKKDYTDWLHHAIPWSLFSAATLGTGIMMGGAWAYESLSFGGFWAWDPVENASLVPWLMIVAGVHTLIAYKYTKRGLTLSYGLLLWSFICILIATFLTRSGILGETSVHAFTDLGMTAQLVVYVLLIAVPTTMLWVYTWFVAPKVEGEESVLSREFWLFIGALIFLISAVQILFDTCWPLWNKLFDTNRVIENPEKHYNSVQIVIAILLTILASLVQYLVYKKQLLTKYAYSLLFSLGLSVFFTIWIAGYFDISFIASYQFYSGSSSFQFVSVYWLLLLSSLFAIFSNLLYILLVVRTRIWSWTGSVSHIGFGIFLVGILISQYKQEVISINQTGVDFGSDFDMQQKRENILLVQGDTVWMNPYYVQYQYREKDAPNTKFVVAYYKKDEEGNLIKQFELEPNAQISPNMGLISNPDTKHFWHKDVFTHVTSVPDDPKPDPPTTHVVGIGDTIATSSYILVLNEIVANPANAGIQYGDSLIAIGGRFSVLNEKQQTIGDALPVYMINTNSKVVYSPEWKHDVLQLSMSVEKVQPEDETLVIRIVDENTSDDFIIMKAIIFPHINLVWLGSILMVIGFLFSMVRRMKKK